MSSNECNNELKNKNKIDLNIGFKVLENITAGDIIA